MKRKHSSYYVINYDNNKLINFYIDNELEFDENKGYFGDNIKSFVIIENKQIVGAISISNYKAKNFIEALAVTKEYRNKGYGRLLLKKAIQELKKPVYTISKSDLFYKKNGFMYDNTDLMANECKTCEEYNITCFPKVMVYK